MKRPRAVPPLSLCPIIVPSVGSWTPYRLPRIPHSFVSPKLRICDGVHSLEIKMGLSGSCRLGGGGLRELDALGLGADRGQQRDHDRDGAGDDRQRQTVIAA